MPTDDDLLLRLVALNRKRAEEEWHGKIRWLRPPLWRLPRNTAIFDDGRHSLIEINGRNLQTA